jgi:hypothetical protein
LSRLKTGLKKRLENDHSKTGRSGIRSFTVLGFAFSFLKDHHNGQFASLADITAVDMPNREYRFEVIFNMLLELTDVCPLLTKQYIQVGLQIQFMLYNFQMALSAYMVWLRAIGHPTYGLQHQSTVNVNRLTIDAHQFNNQLDCRSITKQTNVRTKI